MAYVQSGVYISGVNEMVAGLKAMSSEATKEVQALNLKVGNMVVKEAKPLLASSLVSDTKSTGALEGSIKASRSMRGVLVTAGNNNSIPYANAQNWGWFEDKKRMQKKNIKPKQFMNKAARDVRKDLPDFYMAELIKIYKKYSGKTATIGSSN
jgi:HK97 gp10 family phage protein